MNRDTLEEIKVPENIYVRMYAAKVVFLDVEEMYLEDVGLEGETILKLEDGIATFQKLKFDSTSYNNDVNYALILLAFKFGFGGEKEKRGINAEKKRQIIQIKYFKKNRRISFSFPRSSHLLLFLPPPFLINLRLS